MNTKMQEYTAYIDKIKESGRRLVNHKCPYCQGEIESLTAKTGEVWDSLAQCPHCEELYMKITRGSVVTGNAI